MATETESQLETPSQIYAKTPIAVLCTQERKRHLLQLHLPELKRQFLASQDWAKVEKDLATPETILVAVSHTVFQPDFEALLNLPETATPLQELLWRTHNLSYISGVKCIPLESLWNSREVDTYFVPTEQVVDRGSYYRHEDFPQIAPIHEFIAHCLASGRYPEITNLEALESFCQQNHVDFNLNLLHQGFAHCLALKRLDLVAQKIQTEGEVDLVLQQYITAIGKWLVECASALTKASRVKMNEPIKGPLPYYPEVGFNENTQQSHMPHPACLPIIASANLAYLRSVANLIPPGKRLDPNYLHITNCKLYEFIYTVTTFYAKNKFPQIELPEYPHRDYYNYVGEENSFENILVSKIKPLYINLLEALKSQPDSEEMQEMLREVIRTCLGMAQDFLVGMQALVKDPGSWNKVQPSKPPGSGVTRYSEIVDRIYRSGKGQGNSPLSREIRFGFAARQGKI